MAAVPPTRLVPRHQTRPPAARSVPRHLMALCQIHCRSHCCRRSHPPQRHCRRRRRQLRGSQCQTRCPFHHPPRLPRLAERYWQRWLTQTRHQTAQPWLQQQQPHEMRTGTFSRKIQTYKTSVQVVPGNCADAVAVVPVMGIADPTHARVDFSGTTSQRCPKSLVGSRISDPH